MSALLTAQVAMRLKILIGFASGPIVAAILGLVSVPIMAWFFSPSDIGRLNVLQVTSSFALLLSVLGLDQAYVREYHESLDRPKLFLSCFLPGFALLFIISAATVPYSAELSSLLFADSNKWLFAMAAAGFFLNYTSRFLSLILRMQERGWAFSMSQILPKTLQLTLILLLALSTIEKSFLQLAGVTLGSQAAVLLIYLWNTKDEWIAAVKSRIHPTELNSLLKFGVPLIFSGLAYWGLAATSTFALRTWSDLEELAVYSLAHSFAGAAAIFQSIFTVIWAPTVYKWVSRGVDMAIIDTIAQQVLAVICAIVAISGSFSWLCDWLLPPEYRDVKYILLCLLMQPLLYTLSEVTCVGISIQRRTIYSIWITFAALVTNLCLNFLLVPPYGAAGAAVANAAAFTVFFVARTEVSARIWRRFPRLKLYTCMTALLAVTTITVFFGSIAPVAIHVFWAALLLGFFVAFRTQWIEIMAVIRDRKARQLESNASSI